MKRSMAWPLTLMVAVLLSVFIPNLSQHAATQELEEGGGIVADVSPEAGYLSPGERHKVQISDGAAIERLQSKGARLVGDYGTFRVLEVDTATAKELRKNRTAEVRDEFNLILLNTGAIDTMTNEAQTLRETSGVSAQGAGKRMHLVQFAGPIQDAWVEAMVGTGVEIVTYIPNNAYLVYGDGASIRSLKRLARSADYVQWDGSYLDTYKIDPTVQLREKEAKGRLATQGVAPEGLNLYQIQLFEDAKTNAETLSLIDQHKTEPVKSQWGILRYINIIVGLSPESVKLISARPDVVSVYPEIIPKKFDERQNQIVAGNITGNVPNPGDWLAYLASQGFTQAQFTASNFAVNVTDSGVDDATTSPNHFALYTSGNTTLASRVIYNRLIGTPNGGSTLQGCDGHGNLNAHIVGGFVPGGAPFNAFPHADASGFRYGMGVAPFVRIGSSVIFDPNSFTFPNSPNLESMAYNDGARISTNSWGASTFGGYDARAQTYDALVRDAQPAGSTFPTAGNQEMVILFAAGNDGSGAQSVGAPGTAKNVITVGASENVQSLGGVDFCGIGDAGADSANDIIGFSSRGPTSDGRKKPDLVAPGTHTAGGVFQQNLDANPPVGTGDAGACFTAGGVCAGAGIDFFPAGQEWYTSSDGTSHSTPAVAGAAALIRQRFINASLNPPSPALTKAALVNTAAYMNGVGANDTLWSNNQGWGLMNLNNFFDLFVTPSILREQSVADTFGATGEQRAITGNVSTNTKPFRVTLAWTDPPGPTSGNTFINNLDLEVTVGGNTYKGNVFTGANSATGGVADTRNNVEGVFVPAGVTGPFVVRVIATNIAGDGVPGNADITDQDFALIIANGVEVNQAVMASAGATITTEGCSPANGALDPNETVTVSLCIQNVGTLATTNVVGTLQATGGVTSPSGPQAYGALAPGGPPVCRNFTFTANGACGGTVTASLQLQDGATNLGTVTYTFTLGTLNTAFTQNFDGVVAPALPAGWTATSAVVNASSSAWVTSSAGTPAPPADTAPNAVFTNDPSTVSDERLDTPAIPITTASAQLTFRNNFDMENTFDGGVLEISIGGGAFQDIITAGGSFVTGGYNGTISVNFSSPIAGRQAWTGVSGGFITTTVNLPAAAMGQSVVLRFRRATDTSVSDVGWRVDTISITDGFVCCAGGQPCAENFDAVTPPAFPAGWTATTAIDCANSNPWETSNAGVPAPAADTAPNAAFVNDPNCISDELLDTPAFPITSAAATLTFRQNRNLENGFDGGVLEASINGGAFQDILATGATFAVGGYNGTISVNFGSPIAGRQAWTGNSAGFVTTTVNLPASANGQSWVFRFRRGTDSSVSGQGWRIDTISSTGTTCGGVVPCDITCPANITVSNDPNQCGAVVNYPAPTSTGSCGTITCSPPSGSFFPVGTTTVTCMGTGDSCSFTVTVADTQPPTITCPSNVTAVTPVIGGNSAVVTFPPPTASDNCPGVTTVCVPPSGSTFPVGTTTVTCTATDASGNTATCSFTVTVFNVCLQDNANPSTVLLFNSVTGQYRFCCNGTVFTGVGSVKRIGSVITLDHAAPDRRVTGRVDGTAKTGSGSLQAPPGTNRCTITDSNTQNNSCVCQ